MSMRTPRRTQTSASLTHTHLDTFHEHRHRLSDAHTHLNIDELSNHWRQALALGAMCHELLQHELHRVPHPAYRAFLSLVINTEFSDEEGDIAVCKLAWPPHPALEGDGEAVKDTRQRVGDGACLPQHTAR